MLPSMHAYREVSVAPYTRWGLSGKKTEGNKRCQVHFSSHVTISKNLPPRQIDRRKSPRVHTPRFIVSDVSNISPEVVPKETNLSVFNESHVYAPCWVMRRERACGVTSCQAVFQQPVVL